ncbi:Ku protein [Paracoccus sp. M683]|uniref:non-homologous end joining protein Ku n=1 Tax=Paracoccus sp. M683 TaxID=2594268 RepID=UPI002105A1FE|nr:Ku protein [Paracoccus sp. M683]
MSGETSPPMASRANWKGVLRIADLSCQVALYSAASTSDRIAFHTINRATGHRVRREFVDGETGKEVERDDQVKGYEISGGEYVMLSDEEIASTVPDSDKTLGITDFIRCDEVDPVYFDRPYYLAPADRSAAEAFALIRQGLVKQKVAALAQTVLFRRMRNLLIRPYGAGMIATTLNYDYEVRAADEVFSSIRIAKIEPEMLDLAQHIIRTKMGKFDPATFEDRYEAAVIELVKAKQEGRKLPRRAAEKPKVISLIEALRASAKPTTKAQSKRKAV